MFRVISVHSTMHSHIWPLLRLSAVRHTILLYLLTVAGQDAHAGPDKTDYNFQEVFELLKANLAGVTGEQLNDAAVRGLLDQLAATNTCTSLIKWAMGVMKSSVFFATIGCRIKLALNIPKCTALMRCKILFAT